MPKATDSDSTTTPAIPQDGPESLVDSLYVPTEITPEAFFEALGKLRRDARDEIERLLQFLDKTEPCPDLEPSLGSSGPGIAEDDLEGDESDNEPSLGSINPTISGSQAQWAQGNEAAIDLEDEHDGSEEDDPAEDDGLSEPSLGWTIDGRVGETHSSADRELAVEPSKAMKLAARNRRGLSKHDSTIENITQVDSWRGKPDLQLPSGEVLRSGS